MYEHRATALASAAALLVAALPQSLAAQEPGDVGPYSPNKALALSFIPGLGQHYVGEHKKGYLQEAVFAGGLVMILAGSGGGNSSGSGSGDGSGNGNGDGFARLRDEFGGDYGGSYGGGSDDGNGALKGVGVGMIAGAVVWSMIDAPRSARRVNARSGGRAEAPSPPSPELAWALDLAPAGDGLAAGLALHF